MEKILKIDTHIGCAMSGLIADSRTLVDTARVESQVRMLIFLINCFHIKQQSKIIISPFNEFYYTPSNVVSSIIGQ